MKNIDHTSEVLKLKVYFENQLGWGGGVNSDIVFNFLLDAQSASRGGVILDAGAGHQRYKPFFSESIYIAQEHPEAGVKNKSISKYDILSDVKNIPLENESVNCVLSTSSLEHFEYPEEFFYEAYRILKPSGTLFIHVHFMYPEHETPYDFQRPTRYGLHRWFSHSGFSDIIIKPASTSIYASTCFIGDAIIEDLGGLRKRLNISLYDGLRFLVNKSYLRKYFLYYFIGKPIEKILPLLVSQTPDEFTRSPVGWIGIAKKSNSGQKQYQNEQFVNNLDFLEKKILKNSNFVIRDGIIVPRQSHEIKT